jgi:hypothetical protein
MKKTEFNDVFRKHTQQHLSPTEEERNFVTQVYEALHGVLGPNNCLQIGSYPRFTAVTPLHDLDVLYRMGRWPGNLPNPAKVLQQLKGRIEKEFKNPTRLTLRITLQTHSITITFLRGAEEFFSVDVVPAYTFDTNEFGQDMYMVPEISLHRQARRSAFYRDLARAGGAMNWIKSDPRGYIEVARRVNERNGDFRKSAKFVKAWKSSCKEINEDFKLKSFHIEQVITEYFRKNIRLEIYDAVFRFFVELPRLVERSRIPDRADGSIKIDEYVDRLTSAEKQKIIQARDLFLKKLEDFSADSSVSDLLRAGFHKRASSSEQYLFDFGIPMLIDRDKSLRIRARVLPRDGGFRERVLDVLGLIEVDRKIQFRAEGMRTIVDLFKWKVKNDDASIQPRGEITDHSTHNDPEYTKYKGSHFVECYAIKDGVCIARAKQSVRLK